MSIRDSIYTDPDSIRATYINPRDALRALSEVADADTGQTANSAVTLPVGVPVGSFGGGDGLGGGFGRGDGGGPGNAGGEGSGLEGALED